MNCMIKSTSGMLAGAVFVILCGITIPYAIASEPTKFPIFKASGFGCYSEENLYRVFRLGSENGGAELLLAMMDEKKCRSFEQGEQVIVEDLRWGDEPVCAIPFGQTDCYWVPYEILSFPVGKGIRLPNLGSTP